MIKILFIFLYSFSTWAIVDLELKIETTAVNQGQIISGYLVSKLTGGGIPLKTLNGQKLLETIYFLEVSPFEIQAGRLASQVKVIFLKVPSTNNVLDTLNGEQIKISWDNVEVKPTESEKSFLLGEFSIPERKNILPWITYGLVFFVLGLGVFWLIRKHIKNKNILVGKLSLKNKILMCQNYDEVVSMWKHKKDYLEHFPETTEAFKKFEKTLFKYQFKPERSEEEVHEVMTSYMTFKTDVSGVLDGI